MKCRRLAICLPGRACRQGRECIVRRPRSALHPKSEIHVRPSRVIEALVPSAPPNSSLVPSSLRWIEADLRALTEEKERLLKDAEPRCQLRRIKVDLADSSARVAMLKEVVGPSTDVLVMTEGLLVYLDEAQVRSLAMDLRNQAGIRWWLLDLASPALLKVMGKRMGSQLANAPMKFGPVNGVAFFEALGWRATHVQSMMSAASRFRRLPWTMKLFRFLPEPNPRSPGRIPWSAVVQLGRA